jgi:molybdopterin molybdotransferase
MALLSVTEALARVTEGLEPLGAERVPLERCLGRVLAEDLAARLTQPPFDASAMDGFAVRAEDVAALPATLRLIGEAAAGSGFQGQVRQGEAVRIFTGAPVPDGADCIVIQEDTDRRGDRVIVKEGAAAGRYVRPAGLDFREGATGLKAGRRLTARDVGLAAAMNRPWLFVHRRPRIGILSTGDEVVMPGDPIGPNQIVSSNALALAAFVTACGGVPVSLGNAPDDADALRRFAAGARGVDLLVSTGGVSVGEHDLVRGVLSEDGLAIDFWEIAMRPGKPLMSGSYRGTPMIGLPGNPVSTLVCSLLFLRPAMERLAGLPDDPEPPVTARLGRDLRQNDRRQDYLRSRLARGADGVLEVTPFEVQDSSMMRPLASSDCLVIRPPHAPPAAAGTQVPIILFPGGAWPL